MKKVIITLICSLVCVPFLSKLNADSVRSYESQHNLDSTNDQITKLLKSFDDSMYKDDESEGFSFRLNSGFWSPFNYDLFSGTLSLNNKLVIVRLEGDSGDVHTISRILEEANILKKGSTKPSEPIEPQKLEEKYHTISQSLNLVAPWLAVLHASWNSPRLTTGQTVFRFTAYLLIDGLMVWAGGTGLWQEPFNVKKYGGSIAAALAIPRLFGIWQHANLIRGHNRTVKLGYTFYLD